MQTLKDKKHELERELNDSIFQIINRFQEKNKGVFVMDIRTKILKHQLYSGSGKLLIKDSEPESTTVWLEGV